jgi:hypothetical protein
VARARIREQGERSVEFRARAAELKSTEQGERSVEPGARTRKETVGVTGEK